MIEVTDTELVFSFPEVDDGAVLRVHFCGADRPDERIPIEDSASDGIRLASVGRFVMYLQPNVLFRDPFNRCPSGLRYPFALLAAVGGRNAITGEVAPALVRSPQNYFSTPPQGGIDGYFLDGQVHPFRAADVAHRNQTRLVIRVFPMKADALAHYTRQLQLIPGPGPMISGLTLAHGGERQCEPIYEDLCCLGDWDQSRQEQAAVWVSGGS
jgi:hypothetical protein